MATRGPNGEKKGEVLGEAFESGVLYEGSFIMPGMEDNESAYICT